ncbi:winged helix-turn-helix domain-containing protein [Micromonospora halophytica]|uniref:Helix-turn-helix domain-containing protein n=1 Tax=Micromonospora halophytica TaxID=47864 RepID=A0A1C5IXH2_9ACTN|nr:Helix-turn-helix domain-containing protein [Micromonospora halophytica]
MSEARPEPGRVTISDPQVMRALAHPARMAIMEHLSATEDGATATECAEIAGLSPSATSYHLRELAKFGLIEEAPSRGDARERVWRAVSPSYYIDSGQDADSETRAAELALVDAHLARDGQRARDWIRRAADEPREWYEAAWFSDSVLLLTAEELAGLNEQVQALLEPYRKRLRADPPAGARKVAVQYRTARYAPSARRPPLRRRPRTRSVLGSWPLPSRPGEQVATPGDTVGSWLSKSPAPGSDTSSSSTVCRSTGG